MVTRYVGECPVCEGSYRLHKNRLHEMLMVHHGYRRPGHGSIEGDCPGVNWSPWELSPEGTIEYVDKFLRPRLLIVQAWLDRATRGEVTELRVQEYDGWDNSWDGRHRKYKLRILTPADGYEFTQHLRDKTREMQHEDESLVKEINRRELRIADWRERPVRTEEEDVARREQERAPARAAREQARTEKQAKRSALDAKQASREQERVDLMNEYRAIFNALASRRFGAQTSA